MKRQLIFRFLFILLITLVGIYISLPSSLSVDQTILGRRLNFSYNRPPLSLSFGQFSFFRDLEPKLGLDLAGGMQVTLLADMKNIPASDRGDALASSKEVISRRIDLFGVSEPGIITLESGDDYQIIVELPGLTDPNQAVELIGQTAKLEFRQPVFAPPPASPSAEPVLSDFIPSGLTGADLKRARVDFDQKTGKPAVSIEFNDEGAKKFADLTKEYLNKPIAIYLDDLYVIAPTVEATITDGRGIITGDYTTEQARTLSIQLNAGALPVPISVQSQKNISATLGTASINQSVRAGLVGLGLVALFMVGNYGLLGVIATLGLIVYGVITLALYKLLPVTLTPPGIAGFILSVGMAVDSNILIFERFKEEVRSGKPWQAALELGFGRAWDSIRDANTATLITAFILFNPLQWSFLPTSGPVRGFALTLALGIFISLFTGIFVTRTFLRLFFRGKSLPLASKP